MAISMISNTGGSGGLRAAANELALEQLPDGELAELARALRTEALRGDRNARGHAHLCEVELRRRHSTLDLRSAQDALDLRPLRRRDQVRPWWKFW